MQLNIKKILICPLLNLYRNFKLINKSLLLVCFLTFTFLVSGILDQVYAGSIAGDGILLYGAQSNTTPQQRAYTNSSNTFGSNSGTVSGSQANIVVLRASPKKNEMVGGYIDTSNNLQIMCYNGSSWVNEWSVGVGTATIRRFNIAYESNSGDVLVLYSRNTGSTNELGYRTKLNSTGCGSSNWSSESTFDPVRTSGVVDWIELAPDQRSSSDLIAAAWSDASRDLSAAIWNGSSFTNEPASARETNLDIIAAASDVDNIELATEATTGEVMLVWGQSASSNANGAFYSACTGGTSSCTWSAPAAVATVSDRVHWIELASDPLTDDLVYSAIGEAGTSDDMTAAYWSGSAWTGFANLDASAEQMNTGAGQNATAASFITGGSTTRCVIQYDDASGTGISWKHQTSPCTGSWTSPSDQSVTPSLNDERDQYQTSQNPNDKSELMMMISDTSSAIYAKRLKLGSDGSTFTWSEPDGQASLGTVNSRPRKGFAFAYKIVNTITLSGTVYQTNESSVYNCSTDNLTIKGATNGGSTYSTTCTVSGGTYSFDVAAPTSAGQPVAVWIDSGETPQATTVTLANNTTSDISSLDMYQSRVVVTHESAGPIANSNLSTADNGDTGIRYSVASSNLTVESGYELHVKSSKTYSPGGTVTTQGSANMHVDDNATTTLANATNTIAGDLLVDGGATININASTNINGGDITTSGTSAVVTTTSGTPTVTMSGTGSIGGGTTPTFTFYNLNTTGSGTTTIANTVTVNNDVSIASGTTLALNNQSVNVNGGNFTTVGTGSVTCSSCSAGTLTISGDGSTNGLGGGSGTITLYNLTLNGSTNTTAIGSSTTSVTILNDLTIGSNRTLTGASGGTINVAHNFANSGVFTANSSTVNFNGAGGTTQVISGTTSFYNLSASTSTTRTLQFAASTTYTVTNNITFTGTSCSAVINLRSSSAAQWNLDDDAGGTTSISYVDVQYSNATDQPITATNSSSSGNNTNWTISGCLSIGGNIYQSDESTPNATSVSVSLSINNGSPTTLSSQTSSYQFTGINASANDSIVVYIDGHASINANSFTNTDGGTQITALHLITDKVLIRHDASDAANSDDISQFTTYPTSGDKLFTYSATGPTTGDPEITITGTETHISGTFFPSSNFTTPKLHIVTGGTYEDVGGANWLTLTGTGQGVSAPLYVEGGTFNTPNDIIYSGSGSIDVYAFNSPGFLDLWFTGSGTYYATGNTILNSVSSESGTFNLGNYDITYTFAITVESAGTITQSSSATTTLKGNGSCIGGSSPSCGGDTGSITFGNLTLGDGAATATISINGTSPAVTVLGNVNITANTTFSVNGVLNVAGNFTNSNVFTANSSTVNLNGAVDSTQIVDGNTTFYNLTATTGDRQIQFGSGDTFTIASSGTFTATGSSCTALIAIRSTLKGTAVNITKTGNISYSYVDAQDLNISASGGTVGHSVDSGNNTNLNFSTNRDCISASTDSTAIATGYSFQRKTFYDDQNSRHWLFAHDGDEIEIRYSTDGTTWNNPATAASGRLSYDTNDFSVWWKQIGTTEYVWLAVASSNDILIRRGELSGTDVTWDSDVITAMNGSGTSDSYSYPYFSLDSSNYMWVGARYYNGTNYVYKAVRSDVNDTGDATWDTNIGFGTTITEAQLSDDQTNPNVFGNIVPLASQDMYATFVVNTAIEGCKWLNSSSAWKDSGGSNTCSVTAGGAGDTEGSSTRSSTVNTKIDDAGDPGAMKGTGRQIVQTSGGTLYSFINDGGSCEIWKSANGSTWSEQDDVNNPACSSAESIAMAIDSADLLHLIYEDDGSTVIKYITYKTIDHSDTANQDKFGSEETVTGMDSPGDMAIEIDGNDIPHVAARTTITNPGVEYSNRVGGGWDTTPVVLEQTASYIYNHISIVISEDNIPEISYINNNDADLTAALGNKNDAASFSLQDVEISVNTTSNQQGASIGIDKEGNTWIAFIDDDGLSNYFVSLIKHNDADAWTTWQAPISNSIVGYEPSISIIGNTIFILYSSDTADKKIVYDSYDALTNKWLGEKTLVTPGGGINFIDVKVRYSNYNFHEPWLLDFVYSDNTDIFWNYVDLRPSKIDDASNFGLVYNNFGSQLLRTNSGNYYSVINKSSAVEVWRSSDGYSWEKQGTSPGCDVGGCTNIAAAIRSTGVIDIVFSEFNDIDSSYDLEHVTFDTGNDTFGSQTNIRDPAVLTTIRVPGIEMDASNKAHIVWGEGSNFYYSNNVGGTFKSPVTIEAITPETGDIALDLDGIPEVAYINSTDDDLTVRKGNANNATEFTTNVHDVDIDVNDIAFQRGVSIAIDTLTGNTWVAYIDDTGGDDSGSNDAIALAKHNYSDGWTTWSTITTKTDVGYEPSIAIAENSQIYVFYQEDSTDQKIVYDIYDSVNSAWTAETTLQTPGSGVDFRDVKAKWSFEWNNFGANRIDYLFSDGTDVYWDYLFIRRSPTNIDDASNFGPIATPVRRLVRTSTGKLYMFVNKAGSCEIWQSIDGYSWTEKDSANNPTCISGGQVAVAIGSDDTLHLLYTVSTTYKYNTFNTSSDTFGTAETAYTTSLPATGSIAVDSNNVPHVILQYAPTGSIDREVRYRNRVGGSWTTSVFLDSVDGANFDTGDVDITINEDNIPELTWPKRDIDLTLASIWAGEGNANNASSFNKKEVDADIEYTWALEGFSIAVDSIGNTWISYKDEDGADDYITLAKHADADAWTTWTTNITNSKVGNDPNLAIDGDDIYLLYQDDQDNIVFDKYDGSAWSGETLLEEHGSLKYSRIRWSFLNNVSYTTYGLDYLYLDNNTNDVFYNRYLLPSLSPGTQDAIATTTNGTQYSISAVSDAASPNDVHLLYLDNSSTKKVLYKRWDNNGASSAWQSAFTVDDTASTTNLYVSLTLDTSSKDLWASWIDQTGDDDIYYRQCNVTSLTSECDTGTPWGTRTSESTATGAVYNSLTTNYSSTGNVFGIWTNTSASPFSVSWSSINAVSGNTAPSAPTTLYTNESDTGAQSGASNPVGVGDGSPVFSAVYADSDVGDIANKYQVIVYSDSGCTAQVWDSGSSGTSMTNCTEGNRCSDINFGGTDLVFDGSQYYWKIKYWDDSDAAGSFSDCTANFYMLSPAEQLRHGNYFFNQSTERKYTW